MRIVFIFFLVLLAFAFRIKEKGLDCSKFKTGKFICYGRNDGNREYSVDRNDSFHIIKTRTSKTVKKIMWTSICEYELFHIGSYSIDTLPDGRRWFYDYDGENPKKEKTVFYDDNFYVFEYTILRDKIIRDTMWILK